MSKPDETLTAKARMSIFRVRKRFYFENRVLTGRVEVGQVEGHETADNSEGHVRNFDCSMWPF